MVPTIAECGLDGLGLFLSVSEMSCRDLRSQRLAQVNTLSSVVFLELILRMFFGSFLSVLPESSFTMTRCAGSAAVFS